MKTLFLCLGMLLPTLAARADYFDDTGYRRLAVMLGAAIPNGNGVAVSQIEFGNPAYLPEGGSGTFLGSGPNFLGKTFTVKGGSSGASGHAAAVASHFYGLNSDPALGRASFTPGITQVDLYLVDAAETVNAWTAEAWLTPSSTAAPLPELNAVQNHSWVDPSTFLRAFGDNDILRRFDFAIVRDGFLAVT